MNSLANMFQGGQFNQRPQNPQFGGNPQFGNPQFRGGNDIPPQQPIRSPAQDAPQNNQNPAFGGFGQQNTPYAPNYQAQQGFNQLNPQPGQFPRFDAWKQEHPNFGGGMFGGQFGNRQQQNWWQRPQMGQPGTDQGYDERGTRLGW